MAKNPKNINLGNQAMLSGDFGESFVGYLLAKAGIGVVRASTIGFDLFAIDNKGKILPKGKIVGISVKTRISQTHEKFLPAIPIRPEQIKFSMKKWGIPAYVSMVIGSKDKKLDVFLFPFNKARQYETGLKGRMSISKLYRGIGKSAIKIF